MKAERLGAVWPKVQPKLLRLLEKRGLTKPQAEDVCQDVAVRALASGVEFHSADDLYRWAGQVARNLHIDLLRSVSRIACDDSVLVDMQADTDIEHEVERKLALATVLKHWLTLRPLDQAALLEGMYADSSEDRGEAVKLAVRRHRARQRLRLLAEGVFGWSAIVTAIRKLRPLGSVTPTTALVAAPVAFLLVSPVFGPAGADDVRVAPVQAPHMARLVVDAQSAPVVAAPTLPAPVRKPEVRRPAAVTAPAKPKEQVKAEVPGGGPGVIVREEDGRPKQTYVCVTIGIDRRCVTTTTTITP